MALRLRIIGDNAAMAGRHPRWTFGVNGGSIGRNDSNDWVLRDPERFVSGRHAAIEHRGGLWWLRDVSTNGTYVNNDTEPLGPDQTHQLTDGDRLRIGDYEIAVEISASNDFPADESLGISDEELDAAFDVKSVLGDRRAHERPQQSRSRSATSATSPGRPVPPPTPPPTPSARARSAEQELWPGIVALCKGAGIDPHALPAAGRTAALQQAGQLLRETLVGFADLARTRADFASEFGISSGARRTDATSPLVQLAAVEQLLERLLSGRGPGDVRAIDEVRGQFSRARSHELATAAALREAVSAVFEKLDPDELEAQLGRSGLATASVETQARLWARYRELYRATVQSGEAGLPAVFLVAFARAYEALAAGGGE
jgi:predicted component of type VI protein secretion system